MITEFLPETSILKPWGDPGMLLLSLSLGRKAEAALGKGQAIALALGWLDETLCDHQVATLFPLYPFQTSLQGGFL